MASLQLLKGLCDLSLKFNFTITASVIKSGANYVADSISRLHETGQMQRFLDSFSDIYGFNSYGIELGCHMSVKSKFFLSFQIPNWTRSLSNWILRLSSFAH